MNDAYDDDNGVNDDLNTADGYDDVYDGFDRHC
jgi:hypothetical protein